MPNITRGARVAGLVAYLAGPGRANEHTDPHLVAGDAVTLAAAGGDGRLSGERVAAVTAAVDAPRRAFGVQVPDGPVWHCSLSLSAAEGPLGDDRWRAVAEEFVAGMGFDDADGRAPCRWAAVHHGPSAGGNDHVHVVVDLVREDGTKARVWRDRPRAQELAGQLERRHGLVVLESRAAGLGSRGLQPAEVAAARAGQVEPARVRLERVVRGSAAVADGEADFVRRVRRAGVLVRPRYAGGGTATVVGFSVALRPDGGAAPVWYGGGRLARDLTLPRLRDGWPAPGPGATSAAQAEWTAAARTRRPGGPRRPAQEDRGTELARCAARVAAARDRLAAADPADGRAWAALARRTAGGFAAWSLRVEATPGPLATAAAELARSAQLRAHADRLPQAPGPSTAGDRLGVAAVARGGRGPVADAALLRQLASAARALHDAHQATGQAQAAERLAAMVRQELVIVDRQLAVTAAPVRSPGPAPAASTRPSTVAPRLPGRGSVQERPGFGR